MSQYQNFKLYYNTKKKSNTRYHCKGEKKKKKVISTQNKIFLSNSVDPQKDTKHIYNNFNICAALNGKSD